MMPLTNNEIETLKQIRDEYKIAILDSIIEKMERLREKNRQGAMAYYRKKSLQSEKKPIDTKDNGC